MARKGRTWGRPNTPWGSKIYFKPSMGRVIARKPGCREEKQQGVESK